MSNPTVDPNNIITMINMDMIGRMKDSSATVGGVGTSPLFEPLIDSLETDRSFNLSISSQDLDLVTMRLSIRKYTCAVFLFRNS